MTHLCGLYVRVVQRQNGPKPKRSDARARTPGRQVASAPAGRFALLLRKTPLYTGRRDALPVDNKLYHGHCIICTYRVLWPCSISIQYSKDILHDVCWIAPTTMQILHVDEHNSDVGLGLDNRRRRRPPFRPHTTVSAYKRGSRTRPRPEQGRLRPGAASTHGNAGRPTHRKPANGPPAPCRSPLHKADDRGASASELLLQAPHVAVDEPIRGAPRIGSPTLEGGSIQ